MFYDALMKHFRDQYQHNRVEIDEIWSYLSGVQGESGDDLPIEVVLKKLERIYNMAGGTLFREYSLQGDGVKSSNSQHEGSFTKKSQPGDSQESNLFDQEDSGPIVIYIDDENEKTLILPKTP